jgi:hypothetical protein
MRIIVKAGHLHFEQGTFSRGDIVEVSLEQFALFEKNDVEAIPDEPAEEVKREPVVENAETESPPETKEPVKPDSA